MQAKLVLVAVLVILLSHVPSTHAQIKSNARRTFATDSANLASDSGKLGRVQEMKEAARLKREEVKQTIQVKKTEAKERFQNIKDTRKQAVVGKIEDHLAKINERITTQFSHVLERLQAILDKIQSRADRAEQSGLDVTSVDVAIGEATTAITDAEAAVLAQTAKVYTAQVSSDSAARNEVQGLMQQLRTDLSVVKEVVQNARRAVQAAHAALKNVVSGGEGGVPSATSSATPTP